MAAPTATRDTRPPQLVREHYEIEKELAGRLRRSRGDERAVLYGTLYNELYRRVPHHPMLTTKASPEQARWLVDRQVDFLRRFLRPDATFLEIGCGDCALSTRVCRLAGRVLALDVSSEITAMTSKPDNLELVLSDGTSIPVEPGSVDVAYSNQLMEHLHPDDVQSQVQNVYRALAPGGAYVCITPNRLIGPHDISRGFDREATGMHLREYTNVDLQSMFRGVGFRAVRIYSSVRGRVFRVPASLVTTVERAVMALPRGLAPSLSAAPLVNGLLRNCRVVAVK